MRGFFSLVAYISVIVKRYDIDVMGGTTASDDTTTARQTVSVVGLATSEASAPGQDAEIETMTTQQDLHPKNRVDYRPVNGPLLELLWSEDEPLAGQTLFLGGEVGSDGKIYCIPGHYDRVLCIDPQTDKIYPVGPSLESNGTKFKWLRGVPVGDCIYGLPCHADEVLKIHVPTMTITKLPIPYEAFYFETEGPEVAKQQREMIWKYHGGNTCPIDGMIYAVPQSAWHVLKIDPTTDTCSLVGPKLEGKYKWYGGVVHKADGAIYCVPHNHPSVLRIAPSAISLHGDWDMGGHKWHGAAAAENGDIVCIPNNSDTVLVIKAGHPEPILTEIGDASFIKAGRHRTDGKYKYLGAMKGTNGKVYIFPSAAEHVLEVDTEKMIARNVGPNLRDSGMEYVHQNKWQNGLTNPHDQCTYAIPLAGHTLLRIDCSKGGDEEPDVTCWNLPAPHEGRDKYEGAVLTEDGMIYTVPNNHKCVMKIESHKVSLMGKMKKQDGKATNTKKHISSNEEYGGDKEGLKYKSGIPTLRASAHRVKFSPKDRKHDPKPRNQDGKETNTTWLPPDLCTEDVFSYDSETYDLAGAIVKMLQRCDPDIVGSFRENPDGNGLRLEDFEVPVQSTWRKVNGGATEMAARYFSEQVAADTEFIELFDKFAQEVALPYTKARLAKTGAIDESREITFYYQRPPTIRLQPGPSWAKVKPHNDAEYGHQNGELNFWIPFTDRTLNGVDLWCESKFQANDYKPIEAAPGQVISFHGSSCRHFVNTNSSPYTRVSMDFRIGVQGFFDPTWQMQGTNDDHGRKEFTL